MITDKGVAVPEDMAEALRRDPAALAAFEALRPDDQRTFVDWATGQAATRTERLAEIGAHVQRHHRRPSATSLPAE
ncbi:YdeI/OmpD-associated family protein [Nakamurella leprariae]|uniref:YdeI/OmpD-associated family protein n=1 Tax=Nakamurella leprariae TaxID=2803911 RepID=A0A938YCE0_9ACTN|nr:YdeI/OmpD-associated family protein [Nakamurella leprariae]MBM9467016.1 YdeI/OmpD-associated family protein [Nakamurella leprariae]